jgi:hypothetical protein
MGFPPNIHPTSDPVTSTEKMIRLRLEVITDLKELFDVPIDAYDFHRLAHWIYTGIDKDLDIFIEDVT